MGIRTGLGDVAPAPAADVQTTEPAKVTPHDVTGLAIGAATVAGAYCFVTSNPGTTKRRAGYVLLAPAAAGAALALVWVLALGTKGI